LDSNQSIRIWIHEKKIDFMSLLFRVILIGKSVILIDPTASVMQ
jgi:hypothetical protein